MGLDIFIETGTQNEANRKSCHGISREFCYQICELAQEHQTLSSELVQIYQIYKLDVSILSKMNVWQFEEKLRYEDFKELSKDEIEALYMKALQPSNELLKNFKALYSSIEQAPERLAMVRWREDWRAKYTDQFEKNIGDYIVDRNFGWDLRIMIDFLEQLQQDSVVRFGFV